MILVLDTLEIKENQMMVNIIKTDLTIGEVVTDPSGQEWAIIGRKGDPKPRWAKKIVEVDVSNTWSVK